jgi:hypothetical protein
MPESPSEIMERFRVAQQAHAIDLRLAAERIDSLQNSDTHQWEAITGMRESISDIKVNNAKVGVYITLAHAVITALVVWFFTRDTDNRRAYTGGSGRGQVIHPERN